MKVFGYNWAKSPTQPLRCIHHSPFAIGELRAFIGAGDCGQSYPLLNLMTLMNSMPLFVATLRRGSTPSGSPGILYSRA